MEQTLNVLLFIYPRFGQTCKEPCGTDRSGLRCFSAPAQLRAFGLCFAGIEWMQVQQPADVGIANAKLTGAHLPKATRAQSTVKVPKDEQCRILEGNFRAVCQTSEPEMDLSFIVLLPSPSPKFCQGVGSLIAMGRQQRVIA